MASIARLPADPAPLPAPAAPDLALPSPASAAARQAARPGPRARRRSPGHRTGVGFGVALFGPLALVATLTACSVAPSPEAADAAAATARQEVPAAAIAPAGATDSTIATDSTVAAAERGAGPVLAAPLERGLSAGLARSAVQPSLPPPLPPARRPDPRPSGADETAGERYQTFTDNPTRRVVDAPVSTFSVDVDTGSWSNIRRFLNGGHLPPRDAVRIEEMINYFPYGYDAAANGQAFSARTGVAVAPWNPERLLMRVAIKANEPPGPLRPVNLVFLIDVSGSMDAPNKLPLLRESLKMLAARLKPHDRLSIVTYANGTAAPLVAVPGNETATILAAIDGLRAAGGTAGASGLDLAYRVATDAFMPNGINRILLATDGDFNVGVTDFDELKRRVADRRRGGIALSTLGFGTGNLNERLMEQLADAGDGAYAYIDTLLEGQKVLVTQMRSTLATVASDVKIQVEFNPARVAEYRLLGYENRALAREDFNNDRVDAGDVGAGHTVTALYELTLVGQTPTVDPLRYQPAAPRATEGGHGAELAFVRIRHKLPGVGASQLAEWAVGATPAPTMTEADPDLRFAAAIASFGQWLRSAPERGAWSVADARALAASGLGADPFGYRAEALRLMSLAETLASGGAATEPRIRH